MFFVWTIFSNGFSSLINAFYKNFIRYLVKKISRNIQVFLAVLFYNHSVLCDSVLWQRELICFILAQVFFVLEFWFTSFQIQIVIHAYSTRDFIGVNECLLACRHCTTTECLDAGIGLLWNRSMPALKSLDACIKQLKSYAIYA